jgi:hypothetical protein
MNSNEDNQTSSEIVTVSHVNTEHPNVENIYEPIVNDHNNLNDPTNLGNRNDRSISVELRSNNEFNLIESKEEVIRRNKMSSNYFLR